MMLYVQKQLQVVFKCPVHVSFLVVLQATNGLCFTEAQMFERRI
jgi:hypothetical protein